MIRRLFWALLGLGLGLVLGVRLVQKVEEAAEKRRPATLAQNAGRNVGSFQARLRDAVDVGRAAATEQESRLRARYGVPTLAELTVEPGDEPDDWAG